MDPGSRHTGSAGMTMRKRGSVGMTKKKRGSAGWKRSADRGRRSGRRERCPVTSCRFATPTASCRGSSGKKERARRLRWTTVRRWDPRQAEGGWSCRPFVPRDPGWPVAPSSASRRGTPVGRTTLPERRLRLPEPPTAAVDAAPGTRCASSRVAPAADSRAGSGLKMAKPQLRRRPAMTAWFIRA